MSVEMLVTPTDPLTGVPSVLMPSSDLPPVIVNEKNWERVADWHHPFHPRASLVNQTKGLAALRTVRKQWTLYEQHHNESPNGYHSLFEGPMLPSTEDEQFRTVVFAAAGYIPRLAIDLGNKRKPRLRPMSVDQRLAFWQSGQIRIDNAITVRDFLIDHALNRNFVDIDSSIVHEFLDTPKVERRAHLGNMLLRAAAYESTASLSPMYRKAKRDKLIPQSKADSAGRFVMNTMGLAKERARAYKALEQRLKVA